MLTALQPLTGNTLTYKTAVCKDKARLDMFAADFWGTFHQHTLFDVSQPLLTGLQH